VEWNTTLSDCRTRFKLSSAEEKQRPIAEIRQIKEPIFHAPAGNPSLQKREKDVPA
jgi:hypothetical protein